MKLKPKTSVKLPRALVYKRFTQLNDSYFLSSIYRTVHSINDVIKMQYWVFNGATKSFVEVKNVDESKTVIVITDEILQYYNTYYKFVDGAWTTVTPESETILACKFSNIAKYQTNQYYFNSAFDYMIKGDSEEGTVQFIRGNIMPLESMTIRYFDDTVNLRADDLIVIENRLYAIESVTTSHKHMPKDYKVYYAVINSIL
jgi:hypothetical protein